MRAGITGKKDPRYISTQSACNTERAFGPLLAGGDAGAALAQGGLLDALKKALPERALNAEFDHHLAGENGAGNSRNGYGREPITTDTGKLAIDVPRDRQASFDPQLIAKYQRHFPGFDEKIVSMYARHEHPGDHGSPDRHGVRLIPAQHTIGRVVLADIEANTPSNPAGIDRI